MRTRNIIFAVIPLYFGLVCSGQSIPNKAMPAIMSQRTNYTITITPPDSALSLNSPLLIEMYYTNITSSDIYMNITLCKNCTPQKILLTKDGKEVEPTAFHRMSTGRGVPSDFKDNRPDTISSHAQRYHPGVFWRFNIDLRKLYNITDPGQYTVTASRTEDSPDGNVVVSSNTVTLNIVP
jgi:hypothetical protein